MLKAMKAPKELRCLIKHVVPLWSTTFSVGKGDNRIFVIKLKRGIFQGDSLSPLLFCLATAPLCTFLGQIGSYHSEYLGEPLTHMFFMDDLKIYGKDPESIDHVLTMVQQGLAAVVTAWQTPVSVRA